MKEQKTFDCVEMKAKIQEQLRQEAIGMSEEEARKAQWERALSDPIIGPLLRKLAERGSVRARG
jgi:hypothetical protein